MAATTKELKNTISQTEGPVEEGVLTVHVKKLCSFSRDVQEDEIPLNSDQSILRIEVDHHTEEVTFRQSHENDKELLCGQVIHFMLETPLSQKTPSRVSFTLVKKLILLQLEETLGTATFNLPDLVAESPTSGAMDLFGENSEIPIATLEVDLMFNYGCLGYGNTFTADKTEHSIMEKCQYSLFPRILVTKDQQEGNNYHRMPLCVPKPHFVPFQHSASFYHSHPPSPNSSIVSPRNTDLKLTKDELKRLPHLCQGYHHISGRHAKLLFLKNMMKDLSTPPDPQPSLNQLQVAREDKQSTIAIPKRRHRTVHSKD